MSNLTDMLVLLALGASVGGWLKLSRARERAVHEARIQCQHHGVQLLDETVGLRGMRWRRIDGLLHLERCYAFEVSTDGRNREAGRLWMIGPSLTHLSMPAMERADSPAEGAAPVHDNVVTFPLRRLPPERLHQDP